MIDDYELIEASFLKQYGIRLRTVEMQWDEFLALLTGLMSDTPLANIISIRSEKDAKIIKQFTPEQREIRREWRSRQAKKMDDESYNQAMTSFSQMFKAMK